MGLPAGVEKENDLRDAGFSSDEINQWKSDTRTQLQSAGFSGQETDEYFGLKNPDMSAMKGYFQENLKKPPMPNDGKTTQADGFLQSLEAGWQMSVTGLLARGQKPDVMLPEDAPRVARIASQVGTLAGDLPAMLAGGVLGGTAGAAAGSAVPVLGTAAGAAIGTDAGAFALPAAVRTTLMQHYEKGDIKDFSDFWDRSSAVFWDTLKQGTIGAATGGAGEIAGKILAPVGAPLARSLGQSAAELSTMVTVGKALDGKVPNAQDFIDGAILVGGLHAVGHISGKLREVYAKTGLRPDEVAQAALQDPTVKQDLASSNVEVPKAFESMVEKPSSNEVTGEEPGRVEAPAPEAPKVPEQTDAAKKILSQVGEQGEKVKKPYTFDKFYQDYVDKYDPIHTALKSIEEDPKSLPPEENPYILSRVANDYRAKTKYALEKGPLDFNTLETAGKSFADIVEPHAENLNDLRAYLISKRALEVEKRGISSGFDVEAAKAVVKDGKSKFEQTANDLTDFQNNVLKYAKDAGVVSDKSFDAMVKEGAAYIPFRRIMEEGEGGSGKGKPSSLKTLKGSDRKIQDPLISIVENTEALYKAAEANRAKLAFADLKDAGDMIEKVPAKMMPVEIKSEEVARYLKEHGIEGVDPEAFTVFRPQSKKLGPNEFDVMRDGKREVYKADPALAEAFKALDGDSTSMSIFAKVARGFTQAKKIGITLMPDFIVKNLIRDQITANSFSATSKFPLTDLPAAMGDLIKKSDTYYEWLKSGGANGTFLELNDRYLNENVYKINEQAGDFMGHAWNVIRKPVEMLKVAGELTEQATRLAEYKRVRESGGSVLAGGYASREITVDFARMGAKMSALNSITAFLNVNVQGVDRTVRAVKDNPGQTLAQAAAVLTVPSVLLWYANHDDPRWKEIPRWQKDMYWLIMTKDHIFRIPKPQELGPIFGSLPERLLEKFFTDNPKALSDFADTIRGVVTPNMVPDAISPAVEQYFNKSLFTGHAIVNSQLEKVLPEYRYNEYTTDSARLLGKFAASLPAMRDKGIVAPVVIENYVRSWSGTLGVYALQMADKALTAAHLTPDPVKPASSLADIPFIKAFVVRYPSATAQSIQDFHDKYSENKQVIDTIRHLARSGDLEAAQKEMGLRENQDKLLSLDGINEALTKQNQFIRMVYKNPDIKPDQKRQIIDGIYNQMIEGARLGNGLSQSLEKSLRVK